MNSSLYSLCRLLYWVCEFVLLHVFLTVVLQTCYLMKCCVIAEAINRLGGESLHFILPSSLHTRKKNLWNKKNPLKDSELYFMVWVRRWKAGCIEANTFLLNPVCWCNVLHKYRLSSVMQRFWTGILVCVKVSNTFNLSIKH